jgi:hypothetical protein
MIDFMARVLLDVGFFLFGTTGYASTVPEEEKIFFSSGLATL